MNATASIPAATVTDFGFWGTMQEHAPADWSIALPTIAIATGCEPEQVRAFLDSRHSRHFADDIQNALFVGASLKDAIDKATAKWMGWTIGRITAKETGIPRGMAYLTGFVVQAAIDDEIYICPDAPAAITGGDLQMLEVISVTRVSIERTPFFLVIPFSTGDFVGRAASTTRHLAQCAQHNQFVDVAQGGVG